MATMLNVADMRPSGVGIWILTREETERDGSRTVYVYTRSALKDPGTVLGMKQSKKGNVTLATVGQKAPILPIVFPSGCVAVAPAATHAIWSPMVDADGQPLDLPVKEERE